MLSPRTNQTRAEFYPNAMEGTAALNISQTQRHQDQLTRLFYEKLERLPLEELYLRDQLEKIRVQGRRSKFKLIRGRARVFGAFSHRPTAMKKDGSLRLLFSDFNQRFFRNRLLGWNVKWTGLPGAQRGICDWSTRTIKIQRGLRGEHLRRTLLHEMCHFKARGHGKRFQSALLRLKPFGETWVDKEIERYQRTRLQGFSAMVRETIETAADSEQSTLNWRAAKKWIAHELGYTSNEFGKAVPWAEKYWRRKRKEFLRSEENDQRLREQWRQSK